MLVGGCTGAGVASWRPASFMWWHFGTCRRGVVEMRGSRQQPWWVGTGDLNSLPSLGVWVLSSVHQNKGHRWGLDEAPGRSRASCHCPPFALLSWTGQPSGTWPALSPVSLPPMLPAFVLTTGHQHCPVSPQAERGLSCRGFHWSSQSPSGRGSSRLGPSRL